MAKKPQKPRKKEPEELTAGEITAEVIETVIRDAVHERLPAFRAMPERSYLELYREALQLIDVGLKMRQEELGEYDGEEDDEDD